MDRKSDTGTPVMAGITGALRAELEKRRALPIRAVLDVLAFLLNFVFARVHLIWGAYPLATAFVAATPYDVFISLAGAVAGALSLGESGIIHAIVSIIVVFLRVVISGGKSGERIIFNEPFAIKLSVAAIGAFLSSVYRLLLGGLDTAGLLYTLASCLLTSLFTLVFSGLFIADFRLSDAIVGRVAVFEKTRTGREKYNFYLFGISFLTLIFFVSLALAPYSLLGIDIDFVFAAFMALFAAKRFGAVRAMAVGFVASVGASSVYSAGFALLGLGAGLLFPLGTTYAILGGGALLSAWSAYSGELVGFLSTLPEYAAAISILFPFLHLISPEKKEELREDTRRIAADMVSSMALSHRNERGGGVDALASSVAALSSLAGRFAKSEHFPKKALVRELVLDAVKTKCRDCEHFEACREINPAPCAEIVDSTTELLYKNEIIGDDGDFPEYCKKHGELVRAIMSSYANILKIRHGVRSFSSVSEEYELLAKMINEARCAEDEEWGCDSSLSERLAEILPEFSLNSGVAKAYGTRKKRFIIAGDDEYGDIISSKELRERIEKISGYKLGVPEFYRKGDVAMLDCLAAPSYAVDFVSRSSVADGSGVSGDTSLSLVTPDGYFFAILSDGMGSGEVAKSVSCFVCDYYSSMLNTSVSDNTALAALNSMIREGGDECSATLDLFRFDLLRGEGKFLKSGAASSYIKREGSLFRIRSETAPLGLMKTIDAERIRVDCRVGDLVIMLSDGVADSSDYSAAWLPEVLSRPFSGDIGEFADEILNVAQKKSHTRDDMTVSVMQIRKL